MSKQSITLLHTDRTDVIGLGRNLQTTVDVVNTLIGANEAPVIPKLSRLEVAEEPAITTFTQATAQVDKLSRTAKTTNDKLAQLEETSITTTENVEVLQVASRFVSLPSQDFNSPAWAGFTGKAYSAVLGSDLSNPPTGVTLSAVATYKVFVTATAEGAYSETVQLIGNSQNRIFVRSGSAFADAVTEGWKEL